MHSKLSRNGSVKTSAFHGMDQALLEQRVQGKLVLHFSILNHRTRKSAFSSLELFKMENQIIERKPYASNFLPANLVELKSLAQTMSGALSIPKAFVGKPADILAAFLFGSEIGLSPMQSLNYIAMINGKPCLYGDAMKAIVLGSPLCEYIREEFIFDEKNPNDMTKWAYKCETKRRGKNSFPRVEIFSYEDAKKGGLWGKAGPWTTFPKRMLMFRSRAFCLRDEYADILSGIQSAEEQLDIIELKKNEKGVYSPKNEMKSIEAPSIESESPELEVEAEVIEDDDNSNSEPRLKIKDHEKFKELAEAIEMYMLQDQIKTATKGQDWPEFNIERFDGLWNYVDGFIASGKRD